MKAKQFGQAGLQGWRGKVADAVATPIAGRSNATKEQVRSVVGAIFLLLTLAYLAQAVRQLASRG